MTRAGSTNALPPHSGRVDKLIELDSLRGLMALWVAVSHICFFAGFKSDRGLTGILAHGGTAVNVFVILSGFAIASSVTHTSASYGQYLARRLCRIGPVFAIALVLGLLTADLYRIVFDHLRWLATDEVARISQRTASEHANTAAHLVAHLAGLHGAIPDAWLYGSSLAFNSPLWSLSLEWQFYVVAPFVIAALANPRKHPLVFAVSILAALSGRWLFDPWFPQVPSFLPMMLTFFLVGIWCALLKDRIRQHLLPVAIASVVVIVALQLMGSQRYVVTLIVWCGAFGIGLAPPRGLFRLAQQVLSLRPLAAFGERSYGFYGYHLPIMLTLAAWLSAHGNGTSRWAFAAMLLPAIIAAMALAWLSYELMEAPINAWAKRRFRGVRTIPVTSEDGPAEALAG